MWNTKIDKNEALRKNMSSLRVVLDQSKISRIQILAVEHHVLSMPPGGIGVCPLDPLDGIKHQSRHNSLPDSQACIQP
jgi:hypothetical protein